MNLEKLRSNVHNLHSISSAKCIEELFNLILKIWHSVFLEIRQKKRFQAAMKTKENVFICMLKLHFNVAAFSIEIQNSIGPRIVFVCAVLCTLCTYRAYGWNLIPDPNPKFKFEKQILC